MRNKVLVADGSSTMRKIIIRSLQAVGVSESSEAGVSDYLVKPFTADTLREKLEKHGC